MFLTSFVILGLMKSIIYPVAMNTDASTALALLASLPFSLTDVARLMLELVEGSGGSSVRKKERSSAPSLPPRHRLGVRSRASRHANGLLLQSRGRNPARQGRPFGAHPARYPLLHAEDDARCARSGGASHALDDDGGLCGCVGESLSFTLATSSCAGDSLGSVHGGVEERLVCA